MHTHTTHICNAARVGLYARLCPLAGFAAWRCRCAVFAPPPLGRQSNRQGGCLLLVACRARLSRVSTGAGLSQGGIRPRRPRVRVALYPPKYGLPPPTLGPVDFVQKVFITYSYILKRNRFKTKTIRKKQNKQLSFYSGRPTARKENRMKRRLKLMKTGRPKARVELLSESCCCDFFFVEETAKETHRGTLRSPEV